ncbi:hypothetical protein AOL_s00054g205 [Orbilia oligospora ATCC 24927]|uniref:Uncharacterized protein n=1 Tax=Arthrobotrys oligospora (strain ATCC 24927 / CBS 115.81 / DSM 1491) TaxID=756982 RepID=G1X5R1_ARTOA|nr:hypothetical protein AOL_s00054g205 [Orbilia oligospora ATCC 24927]EGX51506.1 hypothetical protein AOL_s00054g205 [Orbilia oligospora ATCC 24927]
MGDRGPIYFMVIEGNNVSSILTNQPFTVFPKGFVSSTTTQPIISGKSPAHERKRRVNPPELSKQPSLPNDFDISEEIPGIPTLAGDKSHMTIPAHRGNKISQ